MQNRTRPALSRAFLTFLSGPRQGHIVELTQAVTTLGADPICDIVCDLDADCPEQPLRVRLIRGDATWRLDSLAGSIILDGQRVRCGVLRDRAAVQLDAQTCFVFSLGTPLLNAGAEHTWQGQRPQCASPRATPRDGGEARLQTRAAGDHLRTTPLRSSRLRTPSEYRDPMDTSSNAAQTMQTALTLPGTGPQLEVRIGGDASVFPLRGDRIDIGRAPANDIVINDRVVSAHHLRLEREGNSYVLLHPHPDRTQTLNGLYLEERHVSGGEHVRKVLANGDTFRIGDCEGLMVSLTYTNGIPIPDALPPMQPLKLGAAVLTIGRRPDCTIVLPHPQVSSLHAMLVREGGAYRLLDQQSTNGMYVNGTRITNRLLSLGDELRIGPYRLVYEANQLRQYDESRFVCIQAHDLSQTGANGAVLLDNISLCIPPRSFVAIIGGSGAGKSTLLDALNGLRPAEHGSVTYNGRDLYEYRNAVCSQMGYVPQDDIVHKDLTVERALYYAAKLRLPSDFTQEQIRRRIDEVLDEVEMDARRHLLVKKLSGGQRKRVSIALELLANPSVFFLDEPTSGLDPGLDRKMMDLLRRLADRGRTIVLVTHATTNLNLCDYICILAQGGKLAYFGPPDEAHTYFGTRDFAEIYPRLQGTDEHPNAPAEAATRFKQSPVYATYVAAPLAAMPAPSAMARPERGTRGSGRVEQQTRMPVLHQVLLLTRRQMELLCNDRSTLVLQLVQAPMLALVVMLLVRSSSGTGLFDPSKVVQCQPQILQSVVTAPPGQPPARGAVQLGIDTSKRANPNAPVDCTQIRQLLSGDPTSQADPQMIQMAKVYTQIRGHGNVKTALQDFVVPGDGFSALTVLFIVSFLAVLPGAIMGVRELVKEAAIYRRERAVVLGIGPYVASKISVMGGIAVLQSGALLVVVNAFEPLQRGVMLPVLLEMYVSILLTALCGLMLGLTVSAFAANEDSANGALPFILNPLVVFAGVEFPLKVLPLQLLGMLDPTRWAVVAMGTSAGIHSDKLGGDALMGSDPALHGTLFSTFTATDASHRLLLAWIVLGGLCFALGLLTCIGLKRKDVQRPPHVLGRRREAA
jgi:ABC-type multidrug transport system ATPase subunit/pSer/pThr/pTyr-binding forkhead associated (FHA) protein